MVIPRSCSSGLESRYRILPASLGDMMPFVAMRASEREVLPWSCSGQIHPQGLEHERPSICTYDVSKNTNLERRVSHRNRE